MTRRWVGVAIYLAIGLFLHGAFIGSIHTRCPNQDPPLGGLESFVVITVWPVILIGGVGYAMTTPIDAPPVCRP